MKLTPCPFCGALPKVLPVDWQEEGDAWGEVACKNARCVAQPRVSAYPNSSLSGAAASASAKRTAVRRWNSALTRARPATDPR